MKKVKDVMTTRVVTLPSTAVVSEAVNVMSTKHISCVVIADKQKPLGIITERDMIKRLLARHLDPKKVRVTQVMTRPVMSIESDCDILQAAKIMHKNRFRRLIILHKGKIGGIVTETDLEGIITETDLLEQSARALQEKVTELRIANEKLQKLDIAKTEFVSMVSHELKTPVASMMSLIQLLHNQELACNPQKRHYLTKLLVEAITQMRRLVDDILSSSRIDLGTLECDKRKVKLSTIYGPILSEARILAQKRNIRIVSDPPPDTLLTADRDRMNEVFYNLFSNAFKFSPEGSTVTVRIKREKGKIHLSIKDNGIGITNEAIPRLFQKFVQVDTSIKRRYQGTGLGLHIVKGIIEMHNGRVWAESEGKNKGSTFHMLLPIRGGG